MTSHFLKIQRTKVVPEKEIPVLPIKVVKMYTFGNIQCCRVHAEIGILKNVSTVLIGKALVERNLAKSFVFKMHQPFDNDTLSNLFNR